MNAKGEIIRTFGAYSPKPTKVANADGVVFFDVQLAEMPGVTQEQFLENTDFQKFLDEEKPQTLVITNHRPQPQESIGADARLYNFLSISPKTIQGSVQEIKLSETDPLTITGKLTPAIKSEEFEALFKDAPITLAPRTILDRAGHIKVICFDIVSDSDV